MELGIWSLKLIALASWICFIFPVQICSERKPWALTDTITRKINQVYTCEKSKLLLFALTFIQLASLVTVCWIKLKKHHAYSRQAGLLFLLAGCIQIVGLFFHDVSLLHYLLALLAVCVVVALLLLVLYNYRKKVKEPLWAKPSESSRFVMFIVLGLVGLGVLMQLLFQIPMGSSFSLFEYVVSFLYGLVIVLV